MADQAGITAPITFTTDLSQVTASFNTMLSNIEGQMDKLSRYMDDLFSKTGDVAAKNISTSINNISADIKPIALQVDTANLTSQINTAVNAVQPVTSQTANIPISNGTIGLIPKSMTNNLNKLVGDIQPAAAGASNGIGTAVSGLTKMVGPMIGITSAVMAAKKGIDFLKGSIDAFAEVEDKIDITSNALRGLGATDEQIDKNEKLMKSLALTSGFKISDISQSMTDLTIKTGDGATAMTALNASMNVARARGLSLSQSSNMVYQAMMGQKRSMNQLGVGYMQDKSQAEILNAILGKVGNTINSVSDDFETSKMRLTSSAEIMKASIGKSLSGVVKDFNEFGSGFNSSIVSIFSEITKATSGNTIDWQTYGKSVGYVIGGVVEIVTGVGKTIVNSISYITGHILSLGSLLINIFKKGPEEAAKEYVAEVTGLNKDFGDQWNTNSNLINTGIANIGNAGKKASEEASKAAEKTSDTLKDLTTNATGLTDTEKAAAEAEAKKTKELKKQQELMKKIKDITFEGLDAGVFSKFFSGLNKGNFGINSQNKGNTTNNTTVTVNASRIIKGDGKIDEVALADAIRKELTKQLGNNRQYQVI